MDPGQQLLHLEGLDNIVVRSHLQAGHLVDGLALGGEHDDGGLVGLPDLGADGPAVHHREHDIQKDQVGAEGAVQLQGLAAVAGHHGLIAFLLQVEVHQLGDVGLILYDEHFSCHRDTCFLWEFSVKLSIAEKFEQIYQVSAFIMAWNKIFVKGSIRRRPGGDSMGEPFGKEM